MNRLEQKNDWPYGKDNQYKIIKNIHEAVNVDTMDTIVTTYKIKDMIDKSLEIIFAILHIEVDTNKVKRLLTNSASSAGELFMRALVPSGSSTSKDGEYRSGYINWAMSEKYINGNERVKALFAEIYSFMVNNMRERKYFLIVEHFYPTKDIKKEHQFELDALTIDNKIKFFCISWFNFYFNFHYSTVPGHLNETFLSLMLKYQHQDHTFFKDLIARYGYENVFTLMYILNNYMILRYARHHSKIQVRAKNYPAESDGGAEPI
jgi:hypothetical protein